MRDHTDTSWSVITAGALADEATLIHRLIADAALDPAARTRITASGADLVRRIRASASWTKLPRWPSRCQTKSPLKPCCSPMTASAFAAPASARTW